MTTAIVVIVLAGIVALAVRSIVRQKKRGGCSGDCGHCKGCH